MRVNPVERAHRQRQTTKRTGGASVASGMRVPASGTGGATNPAPPHRARHRPAAHPEDLPVFRGPFGGENHVVTCVRGTDWSVSRGRAGGRKRASPASLDPELGQDAGDVPTDGAGTDEQRLRDLAVRATSTSRRNTSRSRGVRPASPAESTGRLGAMLLAQPQPARPRRRRPPPAAPAPPPRRIEALLAGRARPRERAIPTLVHGLVTH